MHWLSMNNQATLEDLYEASPDEMKSYIHRSGTKPNYTYLARDNLVFDQNLQIDPNKPENVEAMGKLFYDARGYPHHYGQIGLRIIANAEAQAQKDNPSRAAPAVYADLPALGMDPGKLAPNAIPANFSPTKAPAVSHAPANAHEASATGNQRLSASAPQRPGSSLGSAPAQ